MTCIVGLVHDDKVYIGGDSAGVAGYSISVRSDLKVFKNGPMIMGFTSSFRMGQILQHSLTIPDHDPRIDDYKYMCTTFIDAVMKTLSDKGYARDRSGEKLGGTFLVGYKGQLYYIGSDFQVGINAAGYSSVGCGDDLALGALHALEKSKLKPETKVTKALEAAAAFNAGVVGPFTVESI